MEELAVIPVAAGAGPLEEAAHRHSPVGRVVGEGARVTKLALALGASEA